MDERRIKVQAQRARSEGAARAADAVPPTDLSVFQRSKQKAAGAALTMAYRARVFATFDRATPRKILKERCPRPVPTPAKGCARPMLSVGTVVCPSLSDASWGILRAWSQ